MDVGVREERRGRLLGRWFGGGEERTLTRDRLPASMFPGSIAGPTVNARNALGIPDVLACVRLLSEVAATLPLIAYRRTGNGRSRLVGGRLVELLRRPAPAVTQASLVGQLVASLACHGNGYIGKFTGPEGRIEQIAVLPPERVQIEIKGGMPLYTLTRDDGRQTTHGTDDIVHVRMPLSLDGLVGVSPIALAREALGLARALGQHASALVANEAAPLGVLTVAAGPGADELVENLRKDFEARHGGPKNAGRVAVLSGEVGFAALSLSPEDAQFVEQRRLSTAEVARIFRVPPWLIGAESGDSLTYSNTEGQARALLTYCLAPYLVAVEQALTNDRSLCPGDGTYVEFNRNAILEPDAVTRSQVYAAALDPERGWMRRDEVRRLENLEPEAA